MVCMDFRWRCLAKSNMATATSNSAAILSVSAFNPIYSPSVFYPNFFKPNPSYEQNPRLKVSHKPSSRSVYWVPVVSCSNNGDSEINAGTASPLSFSDDYSMEQRIDVKLPRRSLLVQFTCNTCGERTQRLVNRLAYERGDCICPGI
ncbi:hypothetical protein Ancab_020997 [Ancistrocladus abbreviatus]